LNAGNVVKKLDGVLGSVERLTLNNGDMRCVLQCDKIKSSNINNIFLN